MRHLLGFLLLLGAALPAAASAVTINFDDTTAPCNFNQQVPLTNEYAGQGVTFSGSWEVLNQCGNFAVSGHSSPNFLAYNTGIGGIAKTETLTFSSDASGISFKMGRAGNVTAEAFNASGVLIGTTTASAGTTLVTVSLSATGVRSVVVTGSGNIGVLDDLVFTLGPNNVAPTADAGGPYSLGQGGSVALDGSGSSDSDGSIVNYEWDCTSNGSYDVSSSSPTANSCSYPDDGTYTLTLRVTDDDGAQDTDTVGVTVTNALPSADAGGPYSVNQLAALSLDGSASSDPDGSIAVYEWDCTNDGSYDVSSASPTGSTCTYPDDGSYTVGLRVTDDDGGQATDTATVTATNTAPVANAGGPYSINQLAALSLDGSASSDPDGSIALYEWDCTNDGSYDTASTSGTGSTCTYPDDGPYTVALRVTDDDGGQATDTATVTATNTAPVANAGGPYSVNQLAALSLDGSGSSDPDGSIALYEWDCTNDGSYDTSSASATGSTCTYPDEGSYTVGLRVTDDDGGQATATAAVTATNTAPVADAGGPYSGPQGSPIALDGSGSSDPDGTLSLYEWDCTDDGSYDTSSASPSGSSCTYPADGAYILRLRVTDDDGSQATDTATVTSANTPPIADAGGPYSGDEGVAIAVDAAGSTDVGGSIVLVEWDCDNDGAFEISGTTTAATCTYPDQGSFSAAVRVTDDNGASDTNVGSVSVGNVDPDLDSLVTNDGDEGSSLSFSVSATDVAADTVTVTWDFGDGTTDVGASVSHTYADDGTFSIVVTATDEDGGSATLTGSSIIANVAPVLTSSPPVNAVQGALYTYAPTVTDPGDEVFAWTLSPGAPAAMTLDPSTGSIEWTPTYADSLVGSFSLVLTVDDGDGATDAQSWTIAVSSLDTDGDGLPDDWENDNGLNPNDPNDGAADPDADGLSNLDEFGLGTDPNVYDGPSVPVLVSPIAGLEIVTANPDLVLTNSVDPQNDVLVYDFELYEDEALTVLVTDTAGVAETATETLWGVDVALTENQQYWWRARASDPYVTTDWSLAESFLVNVVNEAPAAPVLTYPTGGETVAELSPELVWTDMLDVDGDVLSYDIELYDAAGILIADDFGVAGDGTEGLWTVPLALTEDAVYSWTVRAVDEHGLAGDWAAEESFFISTENAAPFGAVFLEPTDGADVVSTTPTLVVQEAEDPEGAALTYELELDAVPSFDGAALETTTLSASGTGAVEWDLSAAGITLQPNALAYARVRAVDDGGVASVPDTISFFVRGDNDAPNVPVLVAPADGSTGEGSPTFVAEDPVDPEGDLVFLHFVVARDVELTDVVAESENVLISGAGTSVWVPPSALTGTVYWSARSVDGDDAASEWATPWSYTVESTGDDDDDDDSAGTCDDAQGCNSECEEGCQSSVAGNGTGAAWMLLALLVTVGRRRRR